MISERYINKLEQAKGQRKSISRQITETSIKIEELKKRSGHIDKAQSFAQIVAKETQEKLRYHIEDIVQLALDSCFPDKYDFDVQFNIKRGKTEADLRLLQDGNRVNPMEATGGGVVNLTAFALRVACWSLGKSTNFMVLDEPFANLSKDLQPKAGEILHQLSEKLGLQVVIVTHNKDMIDIADKVFQIEMNKKGISRFKELEHE